MPDTPTQPRPARRRRRWLLVLTASAGVLLVVLGLVFRSHLDDWARRAVIGRLSEALDADVRLDSLELRLWGLEGDFRGLELSLRAPGADPMHVSVVSGRCRLSWLGLPGLAAGRVHLVELRLDKPLFESNREFWRARREAKRERRRRRVDLRIDEMVVSDGLVRFEDQEKRLEFTAEAVEVQAGWGEAEGAIVGQLALRVELRQPPLVHPLPAEVRGRFRLRAYDVELHDVKVEAPGLHVQMEGNVSLLDRLAIVGRGEAQASLELLSPRLDPKFPPMAGDVSGPFSLEAGPNPLQLRGDFHARRARFGPLSADSATARALYARGRLELEELRAEAYGGELAGEALVTWPDPTRFRTRLEGTDLGSDRMFELLKLPLPFAARLDGELVLEGEAGLRASWDGHGSMQAEPREDRLPELPLRGPLDFDIEQGVVRCRAEGLEAASARFDLELVVDSAAPVKSGVLRLVGETRDARETAAGTLQTLDSLGLPVQPWLRQPIDGAGSVGAVIGFGRDRRVNLDLALTRGSLTGRAFDSASLRMGLRDSEMRVERLEIRNGTGGLTGSAVLGLEPFSVLSADVRATRFHPGWLTGLAGLESGPEGALSGHLRISREDGRLTGGGQASLRDAVWFGERVEEAMGRLAVIDGTVELTELQVRGPAIVAAGSASWNPDSDVATVRVEDATVHAGQLEAVSARGARVAGEVGLRGEMQVGPSTLAGRFDVSGRDWRAMDRDLGHVAGHADLDTEGLALELSSVDEAGWSLGGHLGFEEGLPVGLQLRLDDTAMALFDVGDSTLWARLRGRVDLTGSLMDPDSLVVSGELARAGFEVGVKSFELSVPARFALNRGVLRTGALRLQGSDSDIDFQLAYDLQRDHLELSAAGELDLGLLAAPFPEFRAAGPVELDVKGSGPLEGPALSGSLHASNCRLRWLGFPHGLDRISFDVGLHEQRAEVERFTARFGNGELQATGEARLHGLLPESYRATAHGANVRISHPEDFRGVYEGNVEFSSGPEGARLGGRIVMLRGLYDRDVDLLQLMGGASREYAVSDESAWPDDIELDIDFVADGNMWVHNDLARLESSFDLHVGGSPRRPEVTGRLWVLDGGRLSFRDVDYRVVSASLDFVEVDRLDPYLTFLAETSIERYTVRLRVEGTADRFEYELTSQPELSPQDIIALLTTGETLEGLTAAGPGRGAEFTGDLAANYFAGALTAPFEQQLQRLFGLERVRISPTLVQAARTDPTARVTLGEEVIEDVYIIFSTDLEDIEDQLYLVKWHATPKLQLSAKRATSGGVGGDIFYADRFWFTKPEVRREEAVAGESAGPASVSPETSIASVAIRGIGEEDRERLLHRLGFQAGDRFSRSVMFQGVEAIRRDCVETGRIEAHVEVAEVEGPDGVQIAYDVSLGPPVEVSIQGVEKKRERKRLTRTLERFWVDSVFSEELYLDSEERIADYFRNKGFYAVDVRHRVEPASEGRRVVFDVGRGKPVRISGVEIEGPRGISEERVRRQMLTRSSGTFSRRVLVPEVLDDDLKAIRNLYRDQGYLEVRIGRPRIRLSTTADSADVSLAIEEGPRFTLAAVSFPPDLEFPPEQLLEWSGLVVGEHFSLSAMIEGESALRARLDERGYPEAAVSGKLEIEAPHATVRYEVSPGGLRRIGSVSISGNERTKKKIIRRELEFEPGELLSREKLLRSQHRLYQLGVFRNVRISYRPSAGDPQMQDVQVTVSEAKPLSMSVGAGWDTEAKASFAFSFSDNNLAGYDRVLGLQGGIDSLERRIGVVFRDPRMFTRKLPALLSLQFSRRERVSFKEERRIAAFRLDRRINRKWSAWGRYAWERVDLKDVVDPDLIQQEKLTDGLFGSVWITVLRDGRDDLFFPTRGTLFSASVRPYAKMLGSDFQFITNTASWSWVRLVTERVMLATSARIGASFPYGQTQTVPLSERFFTGGDSTVRGFRRDEIGAPEGGEGLLLFNAEFRTQIWGQLKAVLFYDAGQVYDQVADMGLAELRHVLGAGLRYETAFGPVRLEYGRKMDREPEESPGEYLFVIGSAF